MVLFSFREYDKIEKMKWIVNIYKIIQIHWPIHGLERQII